MKEHTRHGRKRWVVLAVVLLAAVLLIVRLLTHQVVHVSGSLAYKSVDDLFAASSLIALGTYTGQSEAFQIQHASADWVANYTDYTFTLSDVFQGKADSDVVTVRLQGGTAGNKTEIYDLNPDFTKDQEYLLFLVQPGMGGGFNTEGDYYYICGLTQGVFIKDSSGDYGSLGGETLSESQLSALAKPGPVSEDIARKEFISNQQNNLANGFITEEEYKAAITGMDQYASILD